MGELYFIVAGPGANSDRMYFWDLSRSEPLLVTRSCTQKMQLRITSES